ncbi:MAG: cold shock domain-containing protein [Nitrospirota bacterium]|jgi:cold shock protein|nr:cold shock domain-containing protein [Nitrospirota bacterium]
MNGKIKKLTDKGFGFISQVDENGQVIEGKDLFFHLNELVGVSFNDLKEGDEVTFEVAESPKGLNATKVSRA